MRVNRKQNINARIIINRVIPGNRRGIKEEKNRDRIADVPLHGVRFFLHDKNQREKEAANDSGREFAGVAGELECGADRDNGGDNGEASETG